jgi:Ca2+/Na+ antiporter
VQGWFGIDREEKFTQYFAKLHLEDLGMPFLYGFAVWEIILGAVFVAILLRPGISPMIYRLAFKMSILLFFMFCMGDILFGDRMELWEHGTFMVLTLLTYQLYLTRSTEHAEVLGEFAAGADINQDGAISTEEFDRFMDRLRISCMVSDPASLRRRVSEEEMTGK